MGTVKYALWAALIVLAGLASRTELAFAGPFPNIQQDVGVCDPNFPTRCAAPDSNGAIPITGNITASSASVGTTGAAVPGSADYVGGNKSGSLVGLTLDGSSNLNVNCASGCAGGTFNNNADGVATSATNGQSATWLYGFNGATFDRLRVDGSKNLDVNVNAALPAGSNSIGTVVLGAGSAVVGHIIADTGSTTAVTGNVTVVQPTGTNLHAVLDTTSTTAVTQATGTNLHAVIDSGSTTAATQATAANLNATVVGTGTFAVQAAATQSGNWTSRIVGNAGGIVDAAGANQTAPANELITGCLYQSSPAAVTTTNVTQIQCDAHGSARGVVMDAAGNARGANVNASNQLSVSVDNAPVLGAGSAVIGHVIADSGSTTAVTGSVTTTNAALALGQASTTSGQTGPLVQGAVTTNAPSYTTAQTDPLSLTTAGGLRVDLKDTASNTNNLNVGQATAANLNATVVQGTAANLKAQVSGPSTPADAFALGTTSIPVIDQSTVYNGSTSDLAREVANSTNSTGTGIPAAGQLGQCDDTSPTAITENSFGNARIDCATHAQIVTSVPSATAGGTSIFTLTLAASTNATNVKASAGQLYGIAGFNMSSATPVWISLYNNSGTPTCNTSIIEQFMIPGNTTGSGFVYDLANPQAFSSGIAFCATTGIAGTGNPAATTYVVNVFYK